MPIVLDKGYIKLVDSMAHDLTVVNAARISFNKFSDGLKEGDIGLINYLMKNRHGTPFEHNAFTFEVKAPIFVVREWQRHRIGSFNEMSGRYTTLEPDWYIPDPTSVRKRVGKPGHYTYESFVSSDDDDGSEDYITVSEFRRDLDRICDECYDKYMMFIGSKWEIAPEQARLFLHVNHYTKMFWTVNARSLMNFLSLRNALTVMWEIRQYAIEIEKLFEERMPNTYNAFVANGRIAP